MDPGVGCANREDDHGTQNGSRRLSDRSAGVGMGAAGPGPMRGIKKCRAESWRARRRGARDRANQARAPPRLPRRDDRLQLHGDIWTAREDGTGVVRLTDNARAMCSRGSRPTGRWIAFSSNRFGNYDVFVVPATGGTPRPAHISLRRRRRHRLDARFGDALIFRRRAATARSRTSPRCTRVPVAGGQEQLLPMDRGASGDYSPDGKQLVFNRHPGSWSRKHYRGASAATSGSPTSARRRYRQLLRRRALQPVLADVGRRQSDLLRRGSAAERQVRAAGSLDVLKSANNIYRIPRAAAGSPCR